jgi:hypothetical protein
MIMNLNLNFNNLLNLFTPELEISNRNYWSYFMKNLLYVKDFSFNFNIQTFLSLFFLPLKYIFNLCTCQKYFLNSYLNKH